MAHDDTTGLKDAQPADRTTDGGTNASANSARPIAPKPTIRASARTSRSKPSPPPKSSHSPDTSSGPDIDSNDDRATLSLLTIVAPALNEEATIERLIQRIEETMAQINGQPPSDPATTAMPRHETLPTVKDYEILIVDDGSTDSTIQKLKALRAKDPRIKAIALSRNFGKEIAVAAGLQHARGSAVLLMDADLQHPPDLIPTMLAHWRQGYDMVYGERIDRKNEGPIRRAVAKSFYRLFRAISGTKIPPNAGDYRLLSRRAVDALNQLGERARFNKGLFTWIGFRAIGIPFEVASRAAGDTSRWPVRRLVRFALDGIASFTTLPLRIWSIVGLAVSLFAFGYAIIFLLKTLILGTDAAGFPTLIISIMMFSGIQLISLGIMGEYLGRIYEEVKLRPLYLVSERIGLDEASSPREDAATSKQIVSDDGARR